MFDTEILANIKPMDIGSILAKISDTWVSDLALS